MHSSMHCARIILDPKWWRLGQEKDKEIMIGFQKIHDKLFLNVQNQANIETQFVHYRNMEGLLGAQGNVCTYMVELLWI